MVSVPGRLFGLRHAVRTGPASEYPGYHDGGERGAEDTDQSYLAPNLVAASVENEIDGTFTPGQEVWTVENGGTGLFVSPGFEEYAGLAADWRERAIAAENDYLKTAVF